MSSLARILTLTRTTLTSVAALYRIRYVTHAQVPKAHSRVLSNVGRARAGSRMAPLAASTLENRRARVLFAVHDEEIVLLHGFIKKTRSTPPEEISLAERRWKDWQGKRRE